MVADAIEAKNTSTDHWHQSGREGLPIKSDKTGVYTVHAKTKSRTIRTTVWLKSASKVARICNCSERSANAACHSDRTATGQTMIFLHIGSPFLHVPVIRSRSTKLMTLGTHSSNKRIDRDSKRRQIDPKMGMPVNWCTVPEPPSTNMMPTSIFVTSAKNITCTRTIDGA